MRKLGWLCTLSALLCACGSTVGDPCTTETDCGGSICLNKDYTPGGYCTKQCTLNVDNNCPGGSVCISDAISRDMAGCLRTCHAKTDCRAGYECLQVRDNVSAVCVGPSGV